MSSIVWITLTEHFFLIQNFLARAAIHGQHLIEEGNKFVSHRHVSVFFVLGVGTPCNKLDEFDELHLVELFTIRICVCDHYHLRHTKAVNDFFLVDNDPSMLGHEIDAIGLVHVLFARLKERVVDLLDLGEVGVYDTMVLVLPPDRLAEVVPFINRPILQAMLFEEHA